MDFVTSCTVDVIPGSVSCVLKMKNRVNMYTRKSSQEILLTFQENSYSKE